MQLSYDAEMQKARPGMEGDTSFSDIVTAKNTSEKGYHGLMVAQNGEDGFKAPAAATDITTSPLGVVACAHDMESNRDSDEPHYDEKFPVNVLRKGRIWVRTEGTITVGTSTVNVRYAGTGEKGAFAGTAVSMETAVLPNARWVKGVTGAGLALLEINLP